MPIFMNNQDFSGNVDGLVDALIKSTGAGGAVYIGGFYGFDVFAYHSSMVMTRPELKPNDAQGLAAFLVQNRWKQGADTGIKYFAFSDRDGKRILYLPYVNVDRITQRREKLQSEMSELARILESYGKVPA